jgi:hypothetical protein
MITSLPRPVAFDALPPSQAVAASAYAPRAEAPDRRPLPVEAIEPETRVRREQPGHALRRIATEPQAEPFDAGPNGVEAATVASTASTALERGPFGWLGLESTPFVAQLIGQNPTPRDAVAAGRSPTSFRRSPVDLYEEVHSWGRRIELMFTFEGTVTATAS